MAISVVMIGAGAIGASSIGLMWLRGSTSSAGTRRRRVVGNGGDERAA